MKLSPVVVDAPLFFTRQFLYSSILSLSILVLLPISVVSYLSFYKSLVPTERLSIPLSHHSSEPGKIVATFDSASAAAYVSSNSDFDYLVRLNLNAICRQEKSFHELSYAFLLASDINTSSKYIINCDLRYIYAERNWWIPYHLRYWVPPILVDILKLVKAEIELVDIAGAELRQNLRSPLASESSLTLLKLSFLIVDWRTSTVDLVLKWRGVRYYLVEYYYTSFIIGVLAFWGACSTSCVVSALIVLSYLRAKFATPAQIKK